VGLSAAPAWGGGVVIRVADRGAGIRPMNRRTSLMPSFAGAGRWKIRCTVPCLGLNLVKGIVEAHGGTVTVKSAPGKGTEFRILLPAAPDGGQNEFPHSAH
jgi:two-component system OmpR family sensor kinase